MYSSRTGSWITPKELVGLVRRWMECENEKHDTETWGCSRKKCFVEGGKKNPEINRGQGFAKCTIKNMRLYRIPRSTEWNTLLTSGQNQDVRHIAAKS